MLGTLLNNTNPDIRRGVLEHLPNKAFMRACLLTKGTLVTNTLELSTRVIEALAKRNYWFNKFVETQAEIPAEISSHPDLFNDIPNLCRTACAHIALRNAYYEQQCAANMELSYTQMKHWEQRDGDTAEPLYR